MRSHNSSRSIAVITVVSLLIIGIPAARAELISLRPTGDTFVVDPGDDPPHAKSIHEADCDFGAAGSLAIAAATAHVEDATAPNNKPHGFFRSLLRFDASALAGTSIASTTLSLSTAPVMNGGKDIFNPKALSGDFKIQLLAVPAGSEWTQGYGGPETLDMLVTDPTAGLTHNLLEDLLAVPGVSLRDVATLHFDAELLDPDAPQTWVNYSFYSETLNEALSSSDTFTLLLSPADEFVSFTFSSFVQNTYPGESPTLRAKGPILDVHTVPEPASVILLALASTIGFAQRRRHRGRPAGAASCRPSTGCIRKPSTRLSPGIFESRMELTSRIPGGHPGFHSAPLRENQDGPQTNLRTSS